jgi:tetratricopeptide (TPR) repeat protein
MLEIIIIISLSLVFIIFLRRIPEVKIEGVDEKESKKLEVGEIIREVDREFGDRRREVIRLLSRAEDCFQNKDYKMAEACYLKIARLDPENSRIYGRLGIIYLEEKEYRDAVDAFIEAIKREPQNSFWYNNLGLVAYYLGDFEKSIIAYKKAIELDKSTAKLINLAKVYEESRQYQEALETINEALMLEPQNIEYQKIKTDIQAKIDLK